MQGMLSRPINILFKNRTCRRSLGILFCVFTLVTAVTPALAQRPYEMIIPIAAGGSMDLISRAVAEALSQELGEPVIPENKVGAGTLIGMRDVAGDKSADGRRLLITGVGYTTLQFKQGGAAFDRNMLKPVFYVGWQPTVLFTRSSIPAKNFDEFLSWAKNQSDGVTFASSGIGSSPHIAAEAFSEATGVKIVHVPMGGSSKFRPALAGGHVDAVFDAPATRELVDSGQLKAFFVGLDHRLPDWPELPASSDVGLSGFMAGTWCGIFVPAGTPDEVVEKLNATLNAAIKRPVVQERSRMFGISLAGGSVRDFKAFLQADYEKTAKLIQSRGLVIP